MTKIFSSVLLTFALTSSAFAGGSVQRRGIPSARPLMGRITENIECLFMNNKLTMTATSPHETDRASGNLNITSRSNTGTMSYGDIVQDDYILIENSDNGTLTNQQTIKTSHALVTIDKANDVISYKVILDGKPYSESTSISQYCSYKAY